MAQAAQVELELGVTKVAETLRELDLVDKGVDEIDDALRALGKTDIELGTEDARRNLDKLKSVLADFPPELRNTVGGFEETKKAVSAAGRSLTLYEKGVREAAKASAQLAKDAKAAGLSVADYEKKVLRAAKASEAAARRAKSFGRALDFARDAARKLSTRLAADVVRAFAQAMISAASGALKYKLAIDGLIPALKAVTTSNEGADEALAALEEQSDKLGISLSKLQEGYIGLASATKGTRIEGDATIELFNALTEAGIALGRTQAQVGRAFTAVGQIAAKNIVSMEEWRKQFQEAIPISSKAAAEALAEVRQGFDGTAKALTDLISSGRLTAEEFLPALTTALERVGGAAVDERLNQLGPTLGRLQVSAEGAGKAFFDTLEPSLLSLLGVVEDNAEGVEAWAVAFGEQSSIMIDFAADLARSLTGLQSDINSLAAGAAPGFRQWIAEAAEGVPVLGSLAGAVDGLLDTLSGVDAQARSAFDEIKTSAVLAAQGIDDETSKAAGNAAQSFKELSGEARANFADITAEYEISAVKREQIQQELVDKLGQLSNEELEAQKENLELLVAAARDSADDREGIEKVFQDARAKIAEEGGEKLERAIERARVKSTNKTAKQIEKIEADLQRKILAINEDANGQLERLSQARAAAEEAGASSIVGLRQVLEDQLTQQAKKGIDERARLVQEQVSAAKEAAKAEADAAAEVAASIEQVTAAAKASAEARVDATRQALGSISASELDTKEDTLAAFDAVVAGSSATAEERKRIAEELGDALERIEDGANQKRQAAIDAFLAAEAKGAEDRAQLEQELQAKLETIEVAAAQARAKRVEAAIADAKKEADARIAESKRADDALIKSAEDTLKKLADLRGGDEGDGGGGAAATETPTEGLRTARDLFDEILGKKAELTGSPVSFGDPTLLFDTLAKIKEAEGALGRLPQVATTAGQATAQAFIPAEVEMEKLIALLGEEGFQASFAALPEAARENIDLLLSELARIAAEGEDTSAAASALAQNIEDAFTSAFGGAQTEAEALSTVLGELREATDETAAAQTAGAEATEAATQAATDHTNEVKASAGQSGEFTKKVEEAAEAQRKSAEAASEAGTSVTELGDAQSVAGDAAGTLGEKLSTAGDAAGELDDGVAAAADSLAEMPSVAGEAGSAVDGLGDDFNDMATASRTAAASAVADQERIQEAVQQTRQRVRGLIRELKKAADAVKALDQAESAVGQDRPVG